MTDGPGGSSLARAFRGVGWALLLALTLFLLQSALWTPRVPLLLRALVAAIGLLAAFSPAAALVVVAALAPFEFLLVTRVWTIHPFAFSEALLLTFFTGYLWSERRRFVDGSLDADPLALPAAIFTLVVVASCLVQLRVLQLWHNYPLEYAADLVRLLRMDYLTDLPDPRPWEDGRGFLHVAALLLEGIALMRCARTLCGRQRGLARQVAAALVASGAVVALLCLPQPIATAHARHMNPLRVLLRYRWSSQALPSLNAAGVYFMLMGFLAVGLASGSPAFIAYGVVTALLTFGGMWITQTRSAMVSGLTVISAMAVWSAGLRVRWLSARRVALAAVLLSVLIAVLVVVVNPFHVLAAGAGRSLRFRMLFAETGLRMFASAPLTGVGVGQYETAFPDFATADLLAMDARVNNAHNYLLWIAAELGIVGLVAFVWLLIAAGREGVRAVAASPTRLRRLALAGVAAFVISWSVGQPIGLPTVALPFWIAAGLAVSLDPERPVTGQPRSRSTRAGRIVAAAAVVLAVTLPIRAEHASSSIEFSRVRYGFHDSGRRDEHGRLWWVDRRATFFRPVTDAAIDVPMAASLSTTPNGVRLGIRVNGQSMPPVVIPPGIQWQTVRIQPTPDAWKGSRYWRVDLTIDPIDVPPGTPEDELQIAVGTPLPVPAWQLSR